MRGSHHVVVQNRRVRFEFTVRRNVTIVRGDSATGKTTLMTLIEAYDRLGDASGVEVVCDRRCVAISNANWKAVLGSASSGVIDGKRIKDILDHTEDFVESSEFFSWERFFTHLLVQETKDTYLRYAKAELNDAYLNGRVLESVLVAMGQVGKLLTR